MTILGRAMAVPPQPRGPGSWDVRSDSALTASCATAVIAALLLSPASARGSRRPGEDERARYQRHGQRFRDESHPLPGPRGGNRDKGPSRHVGTRSHRSLQQTRIAEWRTLIWAKIR